MNPILTVLCVFIPLTLALICALTSISIIKEYSLFSLMAVTPYNIEEIRNTLGILVLLKTFFIGCAWKAYEDLKDDKVEEDVT